MGCRVAVTYSLDRKLAPYEAAVRLAGLEPVPVSPKSPVSLAGLCGLVISGGCDIDPARYGQAPFDGNDTPDKDRDALEATLLLEAIDTDLPVLAICRGLQMLNVVRGGTLQQDIADHKRKGVLDAHTIGIWPESKLAAIAGATEITVNSRHHQAAGCLGEGLVVTARAPDGIVEGLELPEKRFVVAIQWHPEDRVATHAADCALFEAFAAAAKGMIMISL